MAARAAGGGDEVGEVASELSAALRAKIEKVVGEERVFFNRQTDFGVAGAVFLAEKLRGGSTVVERLWLHYCCTGAVGARALAEVLAEDNTKMKDLNLLGNQSLGDDGAEAMAQMIRKNTVLENLGLGACGVGCRGARALGEALKENATLKGLGLYQNNFGDDGAKALSEALRWNDSLEELGRP